MRKRFMMQTSIAIILGTLLFGPVAAAAQEGSSGLTVTGHGEASAPADSATLQMVIGDEFYGPPQPPQPGSTPGAAQREAIAPVLESLSDAGLAESDITVVVGPYLGDAYGYGGPAIAVLVIELTDPDSQRIAELVDAASVGAADARLMVSRISVAYAVDDCAALDRQAREQAIADARQHAAVQAELLGVTVGDLQASRDLPSALDTVVSLYGPVLTASACAPIDISESMLGPFGAAGFDPTAETTVTAYAQVELTFDMSGDAEATPAS